MHLDLFQKLMFFVDECEEAFDVQIKFRWLPREENKLADSLAKQGANRARPGLW
jgi:ribonuclease HI